MGGAVTNLHAPAEAAWRLPVLPDRSSPSLPARYPWLSPREPRPSTCSLTPSKLRREAQLMLATGWAQWEVAAVLVHPGTTA